MPERADIAGNIDSGVDLYLAIQQAKQRKEQMKLMHQYREDSLQDRHESQMARVRQQQDSLQERADNDIARRKNDANRSEIAAQAQTIRQQIGNARIQVATETNKVRRDTLNAEIENWKDKLTELTKYHDELIKDDSQKMSETATHDRNTELNNQQKDIDDADAKRDADVVHLTGLIKAGADSDKPISTTDAESQAEDMYSKMTQGRTRNALLNPQLPSLQGGAQPASGVQGPNPGMANGVPSLLNIPARDPDVIPPRADPPQSVTPQAVASPAAATPPQAASPGTAAGLAVKAGQRVKDSTGKTFKVKQDAVLPPGYSVIAQ